jgi:deoxyribodipyrimidine photo-lyase
VRVSVALFTADLRVHDNPVLRAALKDAERVVPLFVVDTGIRRTGFAVPNRAAFLADSLADLDSALRARGGAWWCASATWSRRPAGWPRRPVPQRSTSRAG